MADEWVVFLCDRDCYHRRASAARKRGQDRWIAACVSPLVGWWKYMTLRKSEAVARLGKRPCKRCYPEVKVITCPRCKRFVKVKAVFTDYLNDDIRLVLAMCSLHGEVAAEFTDYSELVDESKPVEGPWTREPLPVPRGLGAA